MDRQKAEMAAPRGTDFRRVAALLGGLPILAQPLATPLDVHEMLLAGLPAQALTHLIDSFAYLQKTESLEKAVGISLRTFQRRKDSPDRTLSQEQSGRTWKFAEILARVTALLGSQAEAEQWLERPAMALDRRRPIELLATPAGLQLLEDYLLRLEYGVYT